MPKKAISLTLEKDNLLWLRGRTSAAGLRSVSETLDRLIAEARIAGRLSDAGIRSVVGTIDISSTDPLLETADALIRDHFEKSRKVKRRGRG